MDWIVSFATEHAAYAHWVIFFCLMLAGFNFPISEDLLLILSGVLASTFVPENTLKLFITAFAGAYLSDWVVYWLGRKLGPRLMRLRWFSRFVKRERLAKIRRYYAKYGGVTLFVGRFIPFGVRNCLFMSAGMAGMSFPRFLVADGIACLASNSALFWLAYACSKNCSSLMSYLGWIDVVLFSAFVVAVFIVVWYKKRNKVVS